MDLSIVVPNYNHSKYLVRCIESIINQSIMPREVIVVDDCSTDNSIDIISDFQKQYSFLKLVVNDKNRGAVFTMNRGGELSSGKYLYFLAADDYLMPNFMSIFGEVLKKYPDLVMFKTGCRSEFVFQDEIIEVKENNFSNGWKNGCCYYSPREIEDILHNGGDFFSSPVYLKRVWVEIGRLIESLGPVADWFCNAVISARYGVVHVSQDLLVRQSFTSSYSATPGTKEQIAIATEILDLLGGSLYNDVFNFITNSYILFRAYPVDVLMNVMNGNSNHLLKARHCYYKFMFEEFIRRVDSLKIKDRIEDIIEQECVCRSKQIAIAPNNKVTQRIANRFHVNGIRNFFIFDRDAKDGSYDYDKINDFDFDKIIVASDTYKNEIAYEFVRRKGNKIPMLFLW